MRVTPHSPALRGQLPYDTVQSSIQMKLHPCNRTVDIQFVIHAFTTITPQRVFDFRKSLQHASIHHPMAMFTRYYQHC